MNNNSLLIANQWQLERKLGSGSFGDVYQALNIQTKEYVAIKLESINAYSQQLSYEAKLYRLMKDIQGIPKLYW
jgi:serine/threonine protein kinase